MTQNLQAAASPITAISGPSAFPASGQPWSFYTVIVSLLSGYFLLPLLAANLILLVQPSVNSVDQMLWQQAITLLSWIGILLVLGMRHGGAIVRREIGLVLHGQKRTIFWQTLQLLLLTTVLTIIVNQLWVFLEQSAPTWSAGGNPYAQYPRGELLALSFFAIFTAPMLEEIIFRGLVQSTLDRIVSPILSIMLTCAIFLFFHSNYFGNMKAVSHVLILGLCLGFWRERTRSILPGMAVHLINNILASTMLLMPS